MDFSNLFKGEGIVDKATREQIALIRYKLISPVLAEPGRVQNDYFRKQAAKVHVFPHYGSRKVRRIHDEGLAQAVQAKGI
jgi:hypothetical protein